MIAQVNKMVRRIKREEEDQTSSGAIASDGQGVMGRNSS